MSSNDVIFDTIEGDVDPQHSLTSTSTEDQEEPPVAPVVPSESLTRALRRMQQRQARLRAD